MASGDTKTEAMLNVLGNGGSGDEFRGCCNTKTQSYILDAIDRINAIQPGGTSDFNDLENRPQLNGTAMTGNTNITNFTGTDGTNAGAQGLVPAPAAADADKFLKSDGTWATAGGGGGSATAVKALTADDFNYPADNPTSVALWLLPPGFYERGSLDSFQVRITSSTYLGGGEVAFVGKEGGFGVPVFVYYFSSTATNGPTVCSWYSVIRSIGAAIFQGEICKTVDNLTSTSVEAPLSANQGKILNDRIAALEARITALEGGNASQSSSSSAEPDPGTSAEPTVTCPNCQQQTSEMSPICEHCGYDLSGGGGESPDDPAEPTPEEPTEEPVEG